MHLMGSMKIDPIGIERDRFMKNLTLRYSITQFTYWAASSGIASFATTYLLRRGISSGVVGTLLALAGLCSCMTQPLLAAYADRSRGAALTKLILLLSLLCSDCLLVQMVPGLPITVVAVVYALGVWCSDAAVPLLNALSVAYDNAGYPVNYGVARAFGAVATAVSSLVLGFVIARMEICQHSFLRRLSGHFPGAAHRRPEGRGLHSPDIFLPLPHLLPFTSGHRFFGDVSRHDGKLPDCHCDAVGRRQQQCGYSAVYFRPGGGCGDILF